MRITPSNPISSAVDTVCTQYRPVPPRLAGWLGTGVCDMTVCMQVDRFSVTMDPDLGAAVRDAAERAGMSVSGWLVQAATDRLRNDLLGAALDTWEAADGPFGDEELDATAVTFGIARGARGP
jgi:hypothetical protein